MSDNTETEAGICFAYCQHGGVCKLDTGHAGLHSTGYCEWADDQSLSREDADAIFREKDPAADAIIEMTDLFRALGGAS